MAYRIDYASGPAPGRKPHSPRPWVLSVCAFLVFTLLVHVFWQPGAQILGELLLGQGHEGLAAALEQMVSASRQGVPLREAAVEAFRQAVHGA